MPHSLAQIYIHLVFSTKGRRPLLQDETLRTRTHEYLGGICRNLNCHPIRVGGVDDHVHILCRLDRCIEIATLVRDLKRNSSKWIKNEFSRLHSFAWQAGYGVFSISPGHVDSLVSYIANQQTHHQQETFQDEFRRLLRKYGVEWDERYVWD